jgi:hypothetical protein
MRKIVLLVIVILLAVSGVSFAAQNFGIGIEYGLDVLGGLPNQALVTISMRQLPVVLGVGVQLFQNYFNLGVIADWWLFHTHLVGVLDMYAGPGLYLTLPYFELGGRIPVGLQIWPIGKVLELFLEIAPSMAFVSYRSGISIPNLGLQAGLGFRFWF